MKLTNKITLTCVHLVNGYCKHCHAKRMVKATRADLEKYHGPFCPECGNKLDI